MELTFKQTACPCMKKTVSQVHAQEQTQEVRLPDAMPDIGRILGSWGKVLIRSKEWRGNGMAISGGVMAWVLYAPEDGTEPKSMEAWIPFQEKWDFPAAERDGSICVMPLLKSIDARSISARKMILRANISILGQAWEPVEPMVSIKDSVPDDIELLTDIYPVELPKEVGEKQFQIEEETVLPANQPQIGKILRYDLTPEITEQKVVAGRLIFKGSAELYVMYRSEDGQIHNWNIGIPYSQFVDLDRDYSSNAMGWVYVILTGLELYADEQQRLHLKASMAAQYVVYDRSMLELVQDAYSPVRDVQVHSDVLQLPLKLDQCRESLRLSQNLHVDAGKAVDLSCSFDHPHKQNGEGMEFGIPYQFQTLYHDEEGTLQSATVRAESIWNLPSAEENQVEICLRSGKAPEAFEGAQGMEVSAELTLDAFVFSQQGLPMVTGLELGEVREPAPDRPSLILRKAGGKRLWDIAKECGSTVEAIQKVNGLQEAPDADKILLIPVS